MTRETLIETLIPQKRIERFRTVAAQRIQGLTAVYDGVHDPHNISACIRSAESFGLMEVHHLLPRRLRSNRKISANADQWIETHSYDSEGELLGRLQGEGYTLVGAVPTLDAIPFYEIEIPEKLALVFGAEKWGIRKEVQEHCSAFVQIPMMGFTESLNISTAHAILVQYFAQAFRKRSTGLVSQQRRDALIDYWIDRELRKKMRQAH